MRSIKRKRQTTTTTSDDNESNSTDGNKKRLIDQQQQQQYHQTTLSVINTSTSSILSLKENILGENKSLDNDKKIDSKDEKKEQITVNTIQCSSSSRNFKTKKTNLKNLQNKKISICPPSSNNTKSTATALTTLDNIIIKHDKGNTVTDKVQDNNNAIVPLPPLTWASNQELWGIMKNKIIIYKYEQNYLRKHPGIEPQMRAILLDWVMEIANAYRLHRQTFHLAVEYIDRFMSCTEKLQVDRLQLIGITALFIAAKVEEIYPPKLKEFAYHMDDYCTNNEEAISEFELYMLKTLNWQISPITVNSWLNIYLQIKKVNNHSNTILNTSFVLPPKELHVDYIKAIALVDLCIFDIECLKYKYSQLAACAMYHTIKPSDDALTASGYKLNDLQMCLSWMSTYADIIKENQDSIKLKKFNDVDPDDAHNIQLYFKYLEFLKEAKLRKTPAKAPGTSHIDENILLTPPDSNKKKN